MFTILGAALAALYEPLRVARVILRVPAGVSGVADFLYLCLCGLIAFAYSLEFGVGYFRYYYAVALVFGAAVYFLTLGRLAVGAAKKIAKPLADAIYYKVVVPIGKLIVHIVKKAASKMSDFRQNAENQRLLLQSKAVMVYNNRREVRMQKRKESKSNEKIIASNSAADSKTAQRPIIRARVKRV